MIDLVDRQLTRATNRETHAYYTSLLDYGMKTIKVVAVAAAVAFGIFAAGVAAVVFLVGMPLHSAVGVGVLSGSVGTLLGSIAIVRYVRKGVRLFKSGADGSEQNVSPDPLPPPAANLPT